MDDNVVNQTAVRHEIDTWLPPESYTLVPWTLPAPSSPPLALLPPPALSFPPLSGTNQSITTSNDDSAVLTSAVAASAGGAILCVFLLLWRRRKRKPRLQHGGSSGGSMGSMCFLDLCSDGSASPERFGRHRQKLTPKKMPRRGSATGHVNTFLAARENMLNRVSNVGGSGGKRYLQDNNQGVSEVDFHRSANRNSLVVVNNEGGLPTRLSGSIVPKSQKYEIASQKGVRIAPLPARGRSDVSQGSRCGQSCRKRSIFTRLQGLIPGSGPSQTYPATHMVSRGGHRIVRPGAPELAKRGSSGAALTPRGPPGLPLKSRSGLALVRDKDATAFARGCPQGKSNFSGMGHSSSTGVHSGDLPNHMLQSAAI